jgi:hypothetical protein
VIASGVASCCQTVPCRGVEMGAVAAVSVGYIVLAVDEAISFYTTALGFTEVMHPVPTFGMLTRGDLQLVSAPGGYRSGGRVGRTVPSPHPEGGIASRSRSGTSKNWSHGCAARAPGSATRSCRVSAANRRSSMMPSGNPVELFEPTIDEAKLSQH